MLLKAHLSSDFSSYWLLSSKIFRCPETGAENSHCNDMSEDSHFFLTLCRFLNVQKRQENILQ